MSFTNPIPGSKSINTHLVILVESVPAVHDYMYWVFLLNNIKDFLCQEVAKQWHIISMLLLQL